jgi:hypothetical protein
MGPPPATIPTPTSPLFCTLFWRARKNARDPRGAMTVRCAAARCHCCFEVLPRVLGSGFWPTTSAPLASGDLPQPDVHLIGGAVVGSHLAAFVERAEEGAGGGIRRG